MKQILLLLGILISINRISAQNVGIGTASPDASAKLDVTASDKGFLPPRVNLTATNVATPITSPATGLLVYNQATAGTTPNNVTPGYYYWDGSKWARVMENKNAGLDIGYVVGWASNTAPPDYLLPLSGGTYNWADFPNLQTLNTSYPSQFIASSNATTFTLVDINTAGRFLRGNTTAGVNQDDATALPNNNFTTDNTGAHLHSVDPPATNTSTAGSHNHDFYTADHNTNSSESQGYPAGNNHLAFRTTDRRQRTENNGTIQNAGDHSHSVDITSFNSASSGDHSHTITGGGDTETRPINTSVVWCLKVKSTSTTANITITNTANTAINGLSVYGSAVGLGGNLNQNTNIGFIDNSLTYNLNGTGDFDIQDNGSSALFVGDNGSVGVGTNAPEDKLHVSGGDVRLDNGYEIYFEDNGQIRSLDNNHAIIFNRSANEMIFKEYGDFHFQTTAAGTDRLVVYGNGDVQVNNLSGTGTRPVYADANGILNTNGSVYTSNTTQSGNFTTGVQNMLTTNSINVVAGEIIKIEANIELRNVSGSGNDRWRVILNINGCSSGEVSRTITATPYNNHGTFNYYPYVDFWVATCTGTVSFTFRGERFDSDDSWNYRNIRVLLSKQ